MYSLVVHEDAVRDLIEVRKTSGVNVAAIIEVFLEQAKADQKLLDRFSDRQPYVDTAKGIDIRVWEAQWKRGRNIWRIKLASLKTLAAPYRIIYAFDAQIRRYYVLAILHRDFDYNLQDVRTKRIENAYHQLEITRY